MSNNELNAPIPNVSTVKPSVKSTFGNKDFLKLYIGQFVSNIGSSLSLIVLPLFIFFYTGSYSWLGIISLMQLIPALIISPVAGVFVDTHNRKKIMIFSDIFNTLFILMIPLIISYDFLPEIYVLVGISVMVFMGATVNRYFMPAREASIPHLVKKEELSIAVSISQATFQLIMAIGPIIGTIIATMYGFSAAFILDGLTFIFSAIMIISIKTDLRPAAESNNTKAQSPSLTLGTQKIFQIKTIRFIVIIFIFLIFANASLNSFLVAFVEEDLHMTQVQYGLSVSILGASAVLTAILLSGFITKIKRPLALIAGSFLAGGIILLPIIFIDQAWEFYFILFLFGPINIFINIPGDVIFFRDTQDSFRGQVFSSLNMLISLFTIVGIIYGVILAPIVGLRYLFFGNALIFIVIGFLALFYLFFINNLDSPVKTVENSSNQPVISGD